MKRVAEKKAVLFAEERHYKLVEFIHAHTKATVHELINQFGVSSATIRNDLRTLEQRGLISRTHGGAMIRTRSGYEEALQQRKVHNRIEKQLIARLALEKINDGDTIVIDTGTTMLELAKLLSEKRDLIIITNDIEIAGLLCNMEQHTLIVIGGTVRKRFRCTAGSLSQGMLSDMVVDKAFMAANNFDVKRGASTPDIDTAETKKAMIRIAAKRFLLCAHEKFGTQSFARFAETKDFDVIITDAVLPDEKQAIEQNGVEVIIPSGVQTADRTDG